MTAPRTTPAELYPTGSVYPPGSGNFYPRAGAPQDLGQSAAGQTDEFTEWFNMRMQRHLAAKAAIEPITPTQSNVPQQTLWDRLQLERKASEPHLDDSRGVAGRLSGGPGKFRQVQPNELSDVDLLQEAKALNIENASLIPRPALEKIVAVDRARYQADREPLLEQRTAAGAAQRMQIMATSVSTGTLEAVQSIGENVTNVLAKIDHKNDGIVGGISGIAAEAMRFVFNTERNRAWIGEAKAKVRLTVSEDVAASIDAGNAIGNFVGPFVPVGMLARGIGAATGAFGAVAGRAAVYGVKPVAAVRAGAWLFNGGARGNVVNGALTGIVWDLQHADKAMLPNQEQWADLGEAVASMDQERSMKAAMGIMDTRVGSVVIGAGLDWAFGALGRLERNGATRSVRGPDSGPDRGPDSGPYSAPNRGARLPSVSRNPFDDLGTPVQSPHNTTDNPFAWRKTPTAPIDEPAMELAQVVDGPFTSSTVEEAGTNAIPAVRGTRQELEAAPLPAPVEAVPAVPAVPAVRNAPAPRTAAAMVGPFKEGKLAWPEQIPLPSPATSRFEGLQDTEAARFVRQSGTQATHEDGSLIVFAHETNVDFGMPEARIGTDKGLTVQGMYVRDELSVDPAGRIDQGYGNTRTVEAQERADLLSTNIDRQTQLITHVQELYDTVATGDQLPMLAAQIERLQQGIVQARDELSSLEVGAPMTKMLFGVIRKPFYWDGNISEAASRDLVGTIMTNPAFSGYKKSAEKLQADGAFDSAYAMRSSDFVSLLGQTTHEVTGAQMATNPLVVSDLLRSTGYNAVHNIGGIRSNVAGTITTPHNAWAFLDPRDLYDVFMPVPMNAQTAAHQAAQLSKQAMVMESDILPDIASKVKSSDADVISAAISNNPMGTFAYKFVDNPAMLMESLAKRQVGSGDVHADYVALVAPDPMAPTRLDLIVSTTEPITPGMISDYQRFGMFKGMRAVKSTNGDAVVIFSLHTGSADGMIRDRKLDPKKVYAWVHPTKFEGKNQWSAKEQIDPVTGRSYGKRVRKGGGYVLVENLVLDAAEANVKHSTMSALVSDEAITQMWSSASETVQVGKTMSEGEALFGELTMKQLHENLVNRMVEIGAPSQVYGFANELIEQHVAAKAREFALASTGPDDTFAASLQGIEGMRSKLAADVGDMDVSGIRDLAATRGMTATQVSGTPQWTLQSPKTMDTWMFEDKQAAVKFLQELVMSVEDMTPPTGAAQVTVETRSMDNAGPTQQAYEDSALRQDRNDQAQVAKEEVEEAEWQAKQPPGCLLYTSPSPRD